MSEAREIRCGKDTVHDGHETWQGWCDGLPADPALANPGVPLQSVLADLVTAHPRPWSWSSLTLSQAKELRTALDEFAEHYNRTYVVDDSLLVLSCWPLHPGLAHELAALYGSWLHAFLSGFSSGETAMAWHERWLTGFQSRISHWYGIGTDKCRPGMHVADWNPAAKKLKDATARPDGVLDDEQLDEALRAYVGTSSPLDDS